MANLFERTKISVMAKQQRDRRDERYAAAVTSEVATVVSAKAVAINGQIYRATVPGGVAGDTVAVVNQGGGAALYTAANASVVGASGGGTAGGSGGGVAMTQHDMTGHYHAATGLTAGQVLKATGTTTFGWRALAVGELAPGTAQYQIPVTSATPFTPAYTDLSDFAGNGLTFSAGFHVGAGTLVTVAANTVGLSNGSAQYQIPVTSATPFTPAYTALSSFAGAGIGFSGGQFTVGVANTGATGLTQETDLIRLTSSSAPSGASILASDSGGGLTLQAFAVAPDTDIDVAIGRIELFSVATDNAAIAHHDHANATGYSWRQTATGTTVLNAPAGQSIIHKINNSDVMSMTSGGLDISAGNLTLTSGQDFVVGSNLLFVDGSQGNVGVNCAPDPQFDLDVGGNFRAQGFIVGKHALQIKDARMIVHFDGPDPYSTDETGETNGHMGQVGTANNIVVFRPGKFGKAVEVAATTSNLCSNPQFDSGSTSGWSNYAFGGGTGTRATTTVRSYVGAYSYKITKTDGVTTARFGASFARTINSGQSITFSVMVRIEGAAGGTPVAKLHIEGSFTATTIETTSVTDEWVMLSGTATSNASTTTNIYVWLEGCATGVLYFTDLQITASAYVLPYTSSSRASNGALYYPSSTISGNRGTVMFWFKAPWGETPTAVSAAIMMASGYDAFSLRKKSSSNQIAFRNGSSDVISYTYSGWDREWHHLALTYSAETNTSTLYIDGRSKATGTFAEFTPSTMYVGCPSTNVDVWNGWLDEFATIDRVLSDSEVRSVYESDAPVFAETSVFHFRAGGSLVWADTEGLWMHDQNGNAILGVSAVDSKSWGGRTLNTGDFSLGKYGASNGGWLLFDQIDTSSKPSLTMGYASTEAFRFDASGNKITGALTVTGSLAAGDATIDANGVGIAADNSFSWSTGSGFQNVSVTTGKSYRFTGATQNNFLGITGNYASNTSTLALVNENETASGASKDAQIIIDARAVTDDGVSGVGSSSLYLAASQWAPAQGVRNYAKISMSVASASSINITLDSKTAEIKGALPYATLAKQAATPNVYGSANNQATMYFKGTKIIIVYEDSGTTRYKYLDMAGTGVTWVHTTTAP